MSEIEAVEALHRAAQARLGLAVALLVRDRFGLVRGSDPVRSAGAWLNAAVEAVTLARELSAELARAYYQYARALEIGRTLGEPLDGRPASLGGLRDAFLSRALAIAALGEDVDSTPFHALYSPDTGDGALAEVDITGFVQSLLEQMNEAADTREVAVEEFQWAYYATSRALEDQLRRELTERVLNPLSAEIRRGLRQDGTPKKNLRSVENALAGYGATGGGWADKLTMTVGRQVVENAGQRDRMVLAFARGLGPNPCHFCAALASRGFVYKSRQSASSTMRDGGLRAYHPNCHCYPIARWVKDSPLPAMNQFFADNWKTVTRNASGRNGKLNAWRNWYEDLKRSGKFPPQQSSQEETNG